MLRSVGGCLLGGRGVVGEFGGSGGMRLGVGATGWLCVFNPSCILGV